MLSFRTGKQHKTARFAFTFALLSTLLASVFSLSTAQASVPVPSIQSYTQDFDTLTTTTTSSPWTNDVTLKGWYAAAGSGPVTTISAYDNTSVNPGGGLYSFGATNANERALGVIGGFNANNASYRFGIVLKNTSGSRIKRLNISYTGEQWFDGNTSVSTEKLQFKYKKSATGATLGATDIQTSLGFTSYPALDFISPKNGAAGPIDGNDPSNQAAVSSLLDLRPDLGPNQEMMLVWEKDNIPGPDDGLAIDNLTITAGFGVALPVASCPTTVTTFRGSSVTQPVSAFDPNGTVTQAQITSNPVAGISLADQVPATNPGDTYTANLQIDGTQPVGDYPVMIKFTSQELGETRTCTTMVKVRDITDLAVAKDGPATYRAGQPVTYDITVNPGVGSASDVVVNDTLPAGVTYVSDNSGVTPTINGQQLTWNLGTLSQQKVISLVVQVADSTAGTLTNTVTASTTAQDTNQADNTASTSATLFIGPPDFSESAQDGQHNSRDRGSSVYLHVDAQQRR